MNIRSFINLKLSEALRLFPEIQFRVEYDQASNCTTIEVTPEAYFKEDSAYIEWENNVFKEGFEQFPKENIHFISTSSLTTLERVDEVYQCVYQKFESNFSFLKKPYTALLSGLVNTSFENISFQNPESGSLTFKTVSNEEIENLAVLIKSGSSSIPSSVESGESNFGLAA
jgi:hypothetical protein